MGGHRKSPRRWEPTQTITSVAGSVTAGQWLLAVAVVGASTIVGFRVEHGPDGALIAIAATQIALILHVIAHELGHLIVAVALFLPIVRVRISLGCGPNAVQLAPSPSAALLPLRMVVFFLGGPTTNIVLAAWTYQIALSPVPTLMRCALLGAAIPGTAIGLLTLVPFRTSHGMHSDGANLLRWTFHPTQARDNLELVYRNQRFAQQRKSIENGRVDAAALRTMVDNEPDPRLVLTAV
jgi:hypothetical protein